MTKSVFYLKITKLCVLKFIMFDLAYAIETYSWNYDVSRFLFFVFIILFFIIYSKARCKYGGQSFIPVPGKESRPLRAPWLFPTTAPGVSGFCYFFSIFLSLFIPFPLVSSGSPKIKKQMQSGPGGTIAETFLTLRSATREAEKKNKKGKRWESDSNRQKGSSYTTG